MQVELNTNLVSLFSGTYESLWDIDVESKMSEEQYQAWEANKDLSFNVEFEFKDFMQSIVEAYQQIEDDIVDDLDIPWLSDIKFTGKHNSPREYNFSTDTLDFNAEIDIPKLVKWIDDQDDNFNQWLKKNFSSCDGFWSWTPNNVIDLKNAIIEENNKFDQAIGECIQYTDEDREVMNGLEEQAHDYWRSNGYCSLDYKVVEC